jgi:hypothetical protein
MTACSGVRPLTGLIGARITRVRRIHYVCRGMPNTGCGPLELTFGGRVILLDGAADGEAPRVSTQAWPDPFAGPLSDENRAYADKSGQWTAFDVSAQGALAPFTGHVLASVEAVLADSGKVTGVILRTGGGGIIRVDVEADEVFLNAVTPEHPYRESPAMG